MSTVDAAEEDVGSNLIVISPQAKSIGEKIQIAMTHKLVNRMGGTSVHHLMLLKQQ